MATLTKNCLGTLLILFLGVGFAGSSGLTERKYTEWTIQEAVEVLNKSAWARQETFTRVVGGIGSGIQGEKEIFNTYFVRFLSAPPVRWAYARILQLEAGYDELSSARKESIDNQLRRTLDLDVGDWIVVSVSFRSNDPEQQSEVDQFFQGRTMEALKQSAYLSTKRFPQLRLAAYYPPRERVVGAKFVFPRTVDGVPVVGQDDKEIVFELDVPGAEPLLRATFSVEEMIVDGKLEL